MTEARPQPGRGRGQRLAGRPSRSRAAASAQLQSGGRGGPGAQGLGVAQEPIEVVDRAQGHAAVEHLAQGGDVARRHRRAAGERLDGGQPEALVV